MFCSGHNAALCLVDRAEKQVGIEPLQPFTSARLWHCAAMALIFIIVCLTFTVGVIAKFILLLVERKL